ncbi:phenylalanine--tRNA ligase subunit beta [Algicella marina]|uniref:Phenylalanine--tRNA ligase beta subunit n=1 Tax=Algicella marina TaxID=2683284 RepID=A0A6P1T3S8_9RHOB|nr:phenylalanine--tRNA ligase subunit beta [Algicella marina]QHQ35929.1 phenylalanine--tRNA ligase subunit beta [Algicella marina]
MKFTLGWLKDHLETEASLPDILEALTDLGLEVEGVEDPAERLGAFTVGFVKSAEKHPDADKLRVCIVQTSEGDKQIICGAPNARAGIKVVVASPGDYIPGIDTTIQVGKIRGVESFGMMCSERELEISDEHNGIIELSDDAEVGQRYVDHVGKTDPTIEIAITPNRQDALGVRGIARDLAARGIGKLKPEREAELMPGFVSPIKVTIDEDVLAKGCPHFTGRMIRGVINGPSPAWLQDRLRAIGLRPISTLVDITNLFTYDLNRPLHVFDADKVEGDLRVHFAASGTTIIALDDKEYTLSHEMMAISDANGAESIAGVMGGAATGCTADTVNVFLESAWWDPVTIAMTGRALKINSDARYRFERGVDPAFTRPGLDLAAEMIQHLCGGEVSELVSAGKPLDMSRAYPLDPARVESLVGMKIPESEQIRILTELGFGVAKEHGGIEVWVPSWRVDVKGEADLVEEVARVTSLTKLKGQPMSRKPGVTPSPLTPAQQREGRLRRALAAAGLNECVTYSFVDEAAAALFEGDLETTRIANPISADLSHMRPSLLPALLQAAARNQARGFADLGLFEVGPVFAGGEPEDQRRNASGVRIGQAVARNPHGGMRPVDLYDAKADAEAALAALGAPAKLMALRNAPGWFHPGRSAVLSLGPKNPLAVFGELHPKVLAALDVKGPAVAFTVFPDAVPEPRSKGTARPALTISDYQTVERDFAFVVDSDVEAEQIVRAAQGADKKLITEVAVFDVFAGAKAVEQMGEGKKSVAITVRMEPTSATLTDKEIEAVVAKVIANVTKATGGTLRA